MKRILLSVLYIASSISFTQAQQVEDALKYSTIGFGSTARSAALAGAMGAVGNDPSTLAYNPAGIAVNRYHVFTISLANFGTSTSTDYIGTTDNNSIRKTILPSLGLIFTGINYNKKKPVVEGWANYNFGITINRLSNYHQNFFYEGTSDKSSIADGFATLANKYRDDKNYILSDGGSPENLALQTNLIDNYPYFDSSAQTFVNDYQAKYRQQNYAAGKGPRFTQNGAGNYSGRLNEVDLSFGANHSNKLFLGASLSIGMIKQATVLVHSETDSGSRINEFKSLTFNQWSNTSGNSVGLKLGAIYRITDVLRVGFAYHSPQVFNLHDEYGYRLSVQKDGNISTEAQTADPGFYYDYTFRLPSRVILSLATVKEKSGFFSMDLEIPNYKNASFNDSLNALKERNTYIKNTFNTGTVLRLGGELYRDKLFLRGGMAFYSSPFVNKETSTGANQSRQCFTAGIGYHTKLYSIDFGYIYSQTKSLFSPYTTENPLNYYTAVNASKTSQIILTFISRF